ncbi:hypothetical protein HNR23_004137 [Nocardiopsis mwathae]|uniref:Uncharacterized protein n=1 Tax=Nocardiopsis mwathae TaxID=1472723 RepID=A0A7X0D6Z1_9ACTN|nr:hypothetical protein [Nocardiopsis mwathae]MBB6174077.1 hypothetical protein [Nocardiopsis mwathae]
MKKAGANPFEHFSMELDIRSALGAVDVAEEMLEESPEFETSDKPFVRS